MIPRNASSTGRAWYVVALLMLAYVLSLLDRTILTMMVGPIQRDLQISDTQFGVLHGLTFAIFYTVTGIPFGWLADRYSRRFIIGLGVSLWSAMTILSGVAQSFGHLLLARIGVGVGEASLNPAAYSLLADLFERNKLGKAVGLYSMGGLFGAGAAYLIGGAVAGLLSAEPRIEIPLLGSIRSWQLTFFIIGVPGLLLAALFATIPEPRRHSPAIRGSARSELKGFVLQSRSALFYVVSANALLLLVTHAFLAWTPAMLMRTHGFALPYVGLIMGVSTGLGGAGGYLVGGALADRWLQTGVAGAHMRVGVLGALIAIPLALSLTLSVHPIMVVMSTFALFFFMSLPVAAGVAGLQLITPPHLRALVSSIFMVIVNLLGLGVGPVAVAVMTDRLFADPARLNLSLATLATPMLLIITLLYRSGTTAFTERLGLCTPPSPTEVAAQVTASRSRSQGYRKL